MIREKYIKYTCYSNSDRRIKQGSMGYNTGTPKISYNKFSPWIQLYTISEETSLIALKSIPFRVLRVIGTKLATSGPKNTLIRRLNQSQKIGRRADEEQQRINLYEWTVRHWLKIFRFERY